MCVFRTRAGSGQVHSRALTVFIGRPGARVADLDDRRTGGAVDHIQEGAAVRPRHQRRAREELGGWQLACELTRADLVAG